MSPVVPRTGTDWLKFNARKIGPGEELPVSVIEAAAVGVEAWLKSHEVEYAPALEIPMILIDEKRSRANQARRDPIVQDSVDRFAVAMKAGHAFPPIVAYINGSRLTIIDGNNRQAAARKAGKDTIYGIVISEQTPSELIQLLTVEANAHHGVTPEISWRLRQAFHLCSLGFTDVQAAQAAAVTPQQISNARKVKEADQRAAALKIARFTELPTSARQALSVLRDEAVFYQAARTAVDTNMKYDEVRDLVREVKKKTSEGARIEFIGQVAKERGIEAAQKKALGQVSNRISSPKQSLVTGIGKLKGVDPAALVRSISTVYERDLVNQRIKEAEEAVLALQVAMAQLDDMEEVD